jgi:hypothetical protein
MNAFAFDGDSWQKIKSAYMFHEGIGFVKLVSIRAFTNGEWHVVQVGVESKELIGAGR